MKNRQNSLSSSTLLTIVVLLKQLGFYRVSVRILQPHKGPLCFLEFCENSSVENLYVKVYRSQRPRVLSWYDLEESVR